MAACWGLLNLFGLTAICFTLSSFGCVYLIFTCVTCVLFVLSICVFCLLVAHWLFAYQCLVCVWVCLFRSECLVYLFVCANCVGLRWCVVFLQVCLTYNDFCILVGYVDNSVACWCFDLLFDFTCWVGCFYLIYYVWWFIYYVFVMR